MEPVRTGVAGSHLRGLPAGAGPEVDRDAELDSGPDLADLLGRTAAGDRAAFTELYDATAARVHGLTVRVVRDRAQAEEVTQEVFLEVWRIASKYERGRGSALAWILTIAHRRAVDRVRSSEAAGRRESTYHHRTVPDAHDTTAEAAHASLDAERVRSALATLSDVQREAIELAYFGGYTHTEVATMLGLPLGTAKTRIRDGLIRLRDTIGADA